MRIIGFIICFILCWGIACTNNADNSAYKKRNLPSVEHGKGDILDHQNDTDTVQQINAGNIKYKLTIRQIGDSLHISYKTNTHNTNINMRFVPAADRVLPCNALEIVSNNSNKADMDFRDYYIYKDSVLLLPTFYIDGYTQSLLVFNLFTENLIEDKADPSDFFQYTHLPCFIFNKDNGELLISNSIDADEPLTRIGIYKITTEQVSHVKDTHIKILRKVYDDSVYLKGVINQLEQKIR